ncbi:hypothetical protein E3N88_09530 [Mikania micrantha]|uniref:Uncharacterized protein n=1 Tax=Mikania micrantha TaxID=192012 RepID=A0A5N6PJD7_9ASTR|nr:hypothetical protein E3N88_09530 [Mikania micrantha]
MLSELFLPTAISVKLSATVCAAVASPAAANRRRRRKIRRASSPTSLFDMTSQSPSLAIIKHSSSSVLVVKLISGTGIIHGGYKDVRNKMKAVGKSNVESQTFWSTAKGIVSVPRQSTARESPQLDAIIWQRDKTTVTAVDPTISGLREEQAEERNKSKAMSKPLPSASTGKTVVRGRERNEVYQDWYMRMIVGLISINIQNLEKRLELIIQIDVALVEGPTA